MGLLLDGLAKPGGEHRVAPGQLAVGGENEQLVADQIAEVVIGKDPEDDRGGTHPGGILAQGDEGLIGAIPGDAGIDDFDFAAVATL